MGPERDRFDFALARANCVSPHGPHGAEDGTPPRGEVWFSSELVRSKTAGTTSEGGTNSDTLQALRRWGYVRDLDPQGSSKKR
jgi:hypothetical protein